MSGSGSLEMSGFLLWAGCCGACCASQPAWSQSAFTETVMKTRQKSFRNGVGVFSKRFTSKKERAHDHVPFLNDLRENRGFGPTTNELSARELRVCAVTLRVRRRQCMYAQAVCTASTWFNWTAALSTYFYSRLKIAHPEHTLCR